MNVDEIAKKLVFRVQGRTEGLLTLTDEWDALKKDIAAALAAERAKLEKFAAENERLRKVLDRIAYGPFGPAESDANQCLDKITDFAREALTTKQAAEDAAGGKK
jgi:cell division septum initiation protein DivIVA